MRKKENKTQNNPPRTDITCLKRGRKRNLMQKENNRIRKNVLSL